MELYAILASGILNLHLFGEGSGLLNVFTFQFCNLHSVLFVTGAAAAAAGAADVDSAQTATTAATLAGNTDKP
jgi:hypothetical protein